MQSVVLTPGTSASKEHILSSVQIPTLELHAFSTEQSGATRPRLTEQMASPQYPPMFMFQLCACLSLCNPHANPEWATLAHFSGEEMGAQSSKTCPRSQSQGSAKRRKDPCQGCLHTGVSMTLLVSSALFLVSSSLLPAHLHHSISFPAICVRPGANQGQMGTGVPSLKRLTSSDHSYSSLGWKPKEHSVSGSTLASPPLPEPMAHLWGRGCPKAGNTGRNGP